MLTAICVKVQPEKGTRSWGCDRETKSTGQRLALASLMATALSVWMISSAGLTTVVFAIALNALLLVDFARTVALTLAFHRCRSFGRV